MKIILNSTTFGLETTKQQRCALACEGLSATKSGPKSPMIWEGYKLQQNYIKTNKQKSLYIYYLFIYFIYLFIIFCVILFQF
jgi:hypothetical protein